MLEWIQEHELIAGWLAAISILSFIATLIVVPIVVVRIPSNYFVERRREIVSPPGNLALHTFWGIGKNVIGIVLVILGILMLVLPGQGIITILVGIMLLNFPGKYRLEKWIVSRSPVCRSINWLRRKAGRAPLQTGPER